MKQFGKTTAVLLLAIFLQLTIHPVLSAGAAIPDLQQRQEELSKQIQESQQLLDQKKKEENKALLEMRSLNKTLNTTENNLKTTEKNLSKTQQDLNLLEKELQKTQNELAQDESVLRARLQAIYTEGDASFLEVLFSSTSITDFLTRWDFLSRIAENDATLIAKVTNALANLENKQKLVQTKKETLATLRTDQTGQKRELEVASSRQKEIIQSVQSEKEKAQEELDLLEAESAQIAEELRKLQDTSSYQGSGKMAWPAPGYKRITSPYGWRVHPILKIKRQHTGIDIGAPSGASIISAESGKVIDAGWRGAYGRVIMISHGGDIVTMYCHTSAILVEVGQQVKKGQPIGRVGSTGLSTGPHLHFEVRKNGDPVDPMSYL